MPERSSPSRSSEFHPHALAEFLDALQGYHQEDVGLAATFEAEIRAGVDLIVRQPEIAPAIGLGGVRRKVLHRFRYSIIYGIEPELIRIIAVAHNSRRPGYWTYRL